MSLPPPLQLGALALSSPFVLAPLESVSDAAFRALCAAQGAGLTFTEMIRARGVVRGNRSTLELIDSHDPTVPTGLQLLVTSAEELTAALRALEALAFGTHPHFRNLQVVDLNFGCPSPDVIRMGAGPALLKRRSKLRAIFEALRAFKDTTRLPIKAVGAKIRLGLHAVEQQQKVYLPIVELANDSLDYLTVHARHARQGSSDLPTWSAIAEVKAKARVKVIGNGSLFGRADVEALYAQSGCDGFLIARGAIQSPWVFRGLTGRGAPLPTAAELALAQETYRARAIALGSKEKFLAWHAEGFARVAARLEGKATSAALPINTHMR